MDTGNRPCSLPHVGAGGLAARSGRGQQIPLPATAYVEAPLPVFDEARPAADILSELTTEIERIVSEIEEGVQTLKAAGKADDILVQTCRKLVARAQETLAERSASGFTVRRLEMTRNSLTTTWRQVQSRLKSEQKG